MSNTVERYELDENREITFQRYLVHTVIEIRQFGVLGGLGSRLDVYNDEAVLLRDFLNRQFPLESDDE